MFDFRDNPLRLPGLLHVTASVCLTAAFACAADSGGLIRSPEPGWPQWRGPCRDGISQEAGLLQSWPEEGPNLVWKLEQLGKGWSSPIVVDGRIYITGDVGDELLVYAFDYDGNPLWRATNGKSWTGSFPGARACCVYSKGRLYHLNAHGRVACVEAGTGKEIWSANILDKFDGPNITWALSECLLVDGPRLIITPGGRKALIAALDENTGETIWTTAPLGDDKTSHSSPILFQYGGRRVIASCSSAHGFGIDADDGKLLWHVPLKNQYATNVSTPIYGDGSIYYVTPYAELGRLYRLHIESDGFNANPVWACHLDTVTGSGVLLDGILYSAGYRKPHKNWFGIDWQTGQTRCQLDEFTTGSAIHADGRLYILDETGKAGLVKLDSRGMTTVGRFTLVHKKVRDAWAHPVICDGRLYLRYHDTLWCYDVRNR